MLNYYTEIYILLRKIKNLFIDIKEVCVEVNSLKNQACIHVLSTECKIKSQQKDS
jgi:hypothetical protein